LEVTKLQKQLIKAKKSAQAKKLRQVRSETRKLVVEWNKYKVKAGVRKLKTKLEQKLNTRIKTLNKRLGLTKPSPTRFRKKPQVLEVKVQNNKGKFNVVQDSKGTRITQTHTVAQIVDRGTGQVSLKYLKLKKAKLVKNAPLKSKAKVNLKLNKLKTKGGLTRVVSALISGGALSVQPIKAVKLTPKAKVKTSQKPKQKATVRRRQAQDVGQPQDIARIQKRDSKVGQAQDLSRVQKVAQAQAQDVAITEILTREQVLKLKTKTVKTKGKKAFKIKIPSITPVRSKRRGYQLLIKTPTGFKTITGRYFLQSDANRLGRFLRDNTTGASYKIRPVKNYINAVVGKTINVASKFRPSKKNKKVKVEKRGKRIDTAGEIAGLKTAKLLKKMNLNARTTTKRRTKKTSKKNRRR